MSEKIKWTGIMDDDCVARYAGMVAHCENMGDMVAVDAPDGADPEAIRIGTWFASVSIEGVGGDDLFNSADVGGSFTTGDLARAACEAIMLARVPAHIDMGSLAALRAVGGEGGRT